LINGSPSRTRAAPQDLLGFLVHEPALEVADDAGVVAIGLEDHDAAERASDHARQELLRRGDLLARLAQRVVEVLDVPAGGAGGEAQDHAAAQEQAADEEADVLPDQLAAFGFLEQRHPGQDLLRFEQGQQSAQAQQADTDAHRGDPAAAGAKAVRDRLDQGDQDRDDRNAAQDRNQLLAHAVNPTMRCRQRYRGWGHSAGRRSRRP
jgi:hypothetical protein